MIDATSAFTVQFTPVDGGYLYYPSANTGGRFVTAEEYDRLLSDWRRAAGRRARSLSVGLIIAAVVLGSIVSAVFDLPLWASPVVNTACVVAFAGWLLWASYAPRRLLASRPAVAPPRPRGQARREARDLIGWPMLMFGLILSGAIFFGLLSLRESDVSWWAWVVGSSSMFAASLWIGFQKFADRKR